MSADKSTKNVYVATKKLTYLALPMCAGVPLESQGIPEDAINEGRVFAPPDWTLLDTNSGEPNPYNGQEVLMLELGKFVSAILQRPFNERETISFETVARAEFAQYKTIAAGLKGKPLEFRWKVLRGGKDADGKPLKQFTFGARLPSPQIGCVRQMAPNTDYETGALPTLDGKSLIWYPFVGKDTVIYQYNEKQWALHIEYSKKLDQQVLEIKTARKEAADKRFTEAIETALAVQIEIHPATVEQEEKKRLEEEEKAQVLEKVDA